jgi:hypothetical protein
MGSKSFLRLKFRTTGFCVIEDIKYNAKLDV